MDFNEITMLMDVKLDIYDKRPESLKLKAWTKCEVKIEAIKCLPCFLRISFQSTSQDDSEQEIQMSVSINIPGVNISLATSRFKQHSYGLFWTHNRRDCFIYFALETDMSCRRHMKWVKKSIKNLELYRQVFLEQRRSSRGTGVCRQENKQAVKKELRAVKDALSALGPLPQIPDVHNCIDWPGHVSRASEIYEEIFEGIAPPHRLSRRLSRSSIASGIYEEMQPCSANINSIVEEEINCPPPLPPLPPLRKRLNTSESNHLGLLGDISRSNTNPESDLAKKKKYKNVLESVFISGRSKRSESVSETTACTLEDIINSGVSNKHQPVYANEVIKQPPRVKYNKRNSFSSPDLSKINFVDTFDEEKLADLLRLNSSSDLEAHLGDDLDCDISAAMHNYSSLSLDELSATPISSLLQMPPVHTLKATPGSMESLNVSAKLPQNFNFSARNTSSINLIGASGALPSIKKLKRNKIVTEDDLTGYCVMAPIISKTQDSQVTNIATTSSTTSSTSSGYSSGSYSSSTSSASSSNTQVTENKEQLPDNLSSRKSATNVHQESFYDELPLRKTPLPVAECENNNIYENLQTYSHQTGSQASAEPNEVPPSTSKNFAGSLYENLLTIKAALELEQPLPAQICTSTPTESPAENMLAIASHQQDESIYKTPRKSFVSIDDKIPSYYPNSSETVRLRQRSNSPAQQITLTSLKAIEKGKSSKGLKNFVHKKLKSDRKENLYISSPQKIMEHHHKSCTNTCPQATSASKTKKSANAQKISENVYTVNLANKNSPQLYGHKSNTKNSPYREENEIGRVKEKIQNELLQLALLQKIDFKFDDTSNMNSDTSCVGAAGTCATDSSKPPIESGIAKLAQAELEYENCYQATKDATRLLHKYATLAPKQSVRIQQQHEGSDEKMLMSQSTKVTSPGTRNDAIASSSVMGSKKFASLPRFKKIDFSPLRIKINNVLQRKESQDF